MRSVGSTRRFALLAVVLVVVLAFGMSPSGTATNSVYGCFEPNGVQTTRRLQLSVPTCTAPNYWVNLTTGETQSVVTTTATTTPTTVATTTTPTTTATTIPTTTTTQPAGSFLSYPHQSGRQTFSGSNVVVANKSWVGFTSGACLTVSNATNVWVHDVDFDGCGGAVFLINVTGTVTIENVRARNTGNGSIGSGQGNVVQLNNVFSSAGVIRNVKAYGGDTEDVISIFKSGGTDASHPLVVEDVHVEHPLTGTLAWSSGSGTCANLADAGGHDILLRNSTFLNCGSVGIQMNEPDARVVATGNTVYGAARTTSNVGLSQWSSGNCPSTCPGNAYVTNRVFWQKSSGSSNPSWLSGNYPVSIDTQSKTQDASTPQVHVVL